VVVVALLSSSSLQPATTLATTAIAITGMVQSGRVIASHSGARHRASQRGGDGDA
jgi:hypothetical protein